MGFTYKATCVALRGLFGYGAGWKIEGLENIPKDGGLIVVANHQSNFDPPILGCSLNRHVHFMAKEELFDGFIKNAYMRAVGSFPVKRGAADMGAIKTALKLLKDGQVLGLFPEGTRSKTGKLRKAKLGAVMLAVKSKAPIVPVGLKGTQHPFKEDLEINIGKPFTLDEFYGRKLEKSEMRAAGEVIMGKIGELLEQ
ncbi:1-acyl-sn-glycerol-3-phosphate acyltransferase [Orenia metallireducens]|uniref:1-acyl-sn-glycerol-3-phosphate acyltransferase n=1 Tax=Orenia metallireducens TaxID=1413210 RepID=A0A285H3B8_9FIRM|nr:lysophospholipid acyltransferase family protein [Orenia metallireducens]PRX29499.1 1-acyl-sn-glycerol-3-phosphate acyltransferase [Orenia metallireducens]SNY30262.1 1-acyl-sn-glycerol-3-phosphate acyltransferase [Orenia metallireducens]